MVLGPTGRNFGAGMSDGVAYVLDEGRNFSRKVNTELVHLERLDGGADRERLTALLREHVAATDSARARDVLERWDEYAPRFWKVLPYPAAVPGASAHQAADAGTVAPPGARGVRLDRGG